MKKLSLWVLLTITPIIHAAPLFSIVPQQPFQKAVTPTAIAHVNYTVTNNGPFLLNNIGLIYQPMGQTPLAAVQDTSVSTTPANCGALFSLGAGQSCTLAFTISPSDITGGTLYGLPELCYTQMLPSRCSVPAFSDQLNIRVGTVSLAAGQSGATSPYSPFLVQTSNVGGNWALSTVPSLSSTAVFNGTACNQLMCMASGIDTTTNEPIILESLDVGDTWTLATLPTIVSPGVGSFTASCNSLTCISAFVGSSNNALLQTPDYGITWASVPVNVNPRWTGTTCGDVLCMAYGRTTVGAAELPYVDMYSSGAWHPATTEVSGGSTKRINGGSCYGSHCTVAGYVVGGFAYISDSVDSGVSWTRFTNAFTAVLNAVSCSSNTFCVAVGANSNALASTFLVTGNSVASVWTWTPVTTPTTGGSFLATSCTSTVCVAGGTDGNAYPILVYSLDSGVTWLSVNLTALLGSAYTGAITSVACASDICTASGYAVESAVNVPVLFQSLDGGVTWTLETVSNAPTSGQYNASYSM